MPEGPCGLGHINQFQIILNSYQIIVVSVDHGYQIIFKGPTQPDNKQLILIKIAEHYHTCHSLAGFFGKNYFCLTCEKSFNTEDLPHHRCPGCKCPSCHQSDCQDYRAAQSPATLSCKVPSSGRIVWPNISPGPVLAVLPCPRLQSAAPINDASVVNNCVPA